MNELGTAMRYFRWKPLIYLIPFEWRNCRKQRKQDLIFKEAILLFFFIFLSLLNFLRKYLNLSPLIIKKINTKSTINLHCAGFANLITLSFFVLLHQLPSVFFQLLTPHNEELL